MGPSMRRRELVTSEKYRRFYAWRDNWPARVRAGRPSSVTTACSLGAETGVSENGRMRLVASLEHDECENGSESYSTSAGGHFGQRMCPNCRPVRLVLCPLTPSARDVAARGNLHGAGLIESVETIGSGFGGSNQPYSGDAVRTLTLISLHFQQAAGQNPHLSETSASIGNLTGELSVSSVSDG